MKLIKAIDPNTFEPYIGVIREDRVLPYFIYFSVVTDKDSTDFNTVCEEQGFDPTELRTAIGNLLNGS